ncbi:MAG: hypothetical protein IPH83_06020 [Gammaproteobacteria bacterium]|nr:hypothetical protein [Gammaproteobacteria bacterium]
MDRLDLIHMNGRTYDTRLGRFMQADIVVQSPFDTQSYNRYSYLMNNPLNGTDPSGYFSIKEYTSVIVAVGINWIVPGSGVWYQALVGATAGAAGAANGGNILQGAAIGAFSGAVFAGINGPDSSLAWGAPGDIGQHALNIAANGVAGGAISVVQGGKFGHGFASAGFSSAAGGSLRSANIGNSGVRVIAASIVGGTASVISGGKFANGAMTAAFQAAAGEIGSSSQDKANTFIDSDGNVVNRDDYFDENGNPILADIGVQNTIDLLGGGGQIAAGVAACATIGGCVAGIPLVVLGVSNVGEAATSMMAADSTGFNLVKQSLQLSNSTNAVINLSADLAGLNAPGLAKGGFRLFRNIPSDYGGLKYEMTRAGVLLQAASTASTAATGMQK